MVYEEDYIQECGEPETETFRVELTVNKEQLEAVTQPLDANTQVIAGPGTGKTRTLAYRAAYLISQGVEPEEILMLTLTNRSAQDFRDRIASVVGTETMNRIAIHTFHSFGHTLLTNHGHLLGISPEYLVTDQLDQKQVLSNVRYKLGISDWKEFNKLKDIALKTKLRGFTGQEAYLNDSVLVNKAMRVLEAYNEEIKKFNLLDYDDLIILTKELLNKYPEVAHSYKTVLIDELQDVSFSSWDIIRTLSVNKSLFVVGDPNQSIYRFIGAESSMFTMMKLEISNLSTISLTENYRSQQLVLDLANSLVEGTPEAITLKSYAPELKHIKPKLATFDLESQECSWIVEEVLDLHKNQGVPMEDIVVLTRSSYTAGQLVNSFEAHGVNTIFVGGKSLLETETASVVLTILRALHFPERNIFLIELLRGYKPFLAPGLLSKVLETVDDNNPLIEKLRNYKLWATPAAGLKIREFVGMLDHACSLLEDENMEQIERIFCAVDYVLNEIEYFVRVAKRTSSTNLLVRKHELTTLKKYLVSLESIIQSKMERSDEQKSFLEVLLHSTSFYNVQPQFGQLVISTIHAAKGLEWKNVFIYNVNDGSIPFYRSIDSPEAIEEERRVLFVGITRAKERLYLSRSKYSSRWVQEDIQISRFLTPNVLERLDLIAPKKTTKVSSSDSSVSSSIAATSALKMTGWDEIKAKYPNVFQKREMHMLLPNRLQSIITPNTSGQFSQAGASPMVAWSTLRPAITRCYEHHPHHGLVVGSHVSIRFLAGFIPRHRILRLFL